MNPLDTAIESVGWSDLAKALGVTPQAIRKWRDARRMPRTELTGETDYSAVIEAMTDGQVRAEELREWSRAGWTTAA